VYTQCVFAYHDLHPSTAAHVVVSQAWHVPPRRRCHSVHSMRERATPDPPLIPV
jgi:hypothetical protein